MIKPTITYVLAGREIQCDPVLDKGGVYGTGLPACIPAEDESCMNMINILHAHAPGLRMRCTEQKCANRARVQDIAAIMNLEM